MAAACSKALGRLASPATAGERGLCQAPPAYASGYGIDTARRRPARPCGPCVRVRSSLTHDPVRRCTAQTMPPSGARSSAGCRRRTRDRHPVVQRSRAPVDLASSTSICVVSRPGGHRHVRFCPDRQPVQGSDPRHEGRGVCRQPRERPLDRLPGVIRTSRPQRELSPGFGPWGDELCLQSTSDQRLSRSSRAVASSNLPSATSSNAVRPSIMISATPGVRYLSARIRHARASAHEPDL